MELQQGHGVPACAKECRMAQGHQTGIAKDNIEAHGEKREYEKPGHEPLAIGIEEEGRYEEHQGSQDIGRSTADPPILPSVLFGGFHGSDFSPQKTRGSNNDNHDHGEIHGEHGQLREDGLSKDVDHPDQDPPQQGPLYGTHSPHNDNNQG